jgi:hypothetical protein
MRTRRGGERVRRAQHDTAGLDGIKTLNHKGDNGASSHVTDKTREEGLILEIGVVYTGGYGYEA